MWVQRIEGKGFRLVAQHKGDPQGMAPLPWCCSLGICAGLRVILGALAMGSLGELPTALVPCLLS